MANKYRKIDEQMLIFVMNNRVSDVFRVVTELGADPAIDNSEALVLAASLGYWKMILILRSLGADFKLRGADCLSAAAQNGHKAVANKIQNLIWELDYEDRSGTD